MKFSCSTSDLLSGLHTVSRAIGNEQTLPILQNVLIKVEGKRCTLSATNLELSIVTSFEVSIENEGSITIPAKAIVNFVQYNPDSEILLETSEGTQLKLHSKHAKAVIAGEPASGYPTITAVQRETSLHLKAQPLVDALNLVTFACAKTTSRPVISGVSMRTEKGKLVLVGTDSYRLSEYKLPIDGDTPDVTCIAPARFLEELKVIVGGGKGTSDSAKAKEKERKDAVSSVELHLGSQQIEARVGHTTLTSRLIDGKFPDYQQVLPKEKHTSVTLKTSDLLSAVKRMHYFAKEQNNSIVFSFAGGNVHLVTKQTQLGQDESTIGAAIEGKDNKIALSSTYIIDFLGRIGGEDLLIEISDKMHPAVFKLIGSEAYLHLIMPLRLNDE